MIKATPQIKTNFSKKAQSYTYELKTRISDLEANSPNLSQEIDKILIVSKLLQDVATKAGLYIRHKPFAEMIDNFENVINQLCDYPNSLDKKFKELLIEAIGLFNQVINEYYLGIDLSVDWMELQQKLFTQINEYLGLKADKSQFLDEEDTFEIYSDVSDDISDIDDPFNLDNTLEALHLFDLEFDASHNLSNSLDRETALTNSIEELDNLDGFLMIQVDQEEDLSNSDDLLIDNLNNFDDNVSESTTLLSNTSINLLPETEDLTTNSSENLDDFIPDLENLSPNLHENLNIESNFDLSFDFSEDDYEEVYEEIHAGDQGESYPVNEASHEETLPMPEMLADIFLESPMQKFLGNDDETELVGIRQDIQDDQDSQEEDDLEDLNFESNQTNSVWEQFNFIEDWSNTKDADSKSLPEIYLSESDLSISLDLQLSNDYELDKLSELDLPDINLSTQLEAQLDSQLDVQPDLQSSNDNYLNESFELDFPEFNLSTSLDSQISNDNNYDNNYNVDISDDITLDYSLDSDFQFELEPYQSFQTTEETTEETLDSVNIFLDPDEDSELVLPEFLKEVFSSDSTDIDTALEESPIYQNSYQTNYQTELEPRRSHWNELLLTDLEEKEISYADFAALSLDVNHDLDLEGAKQSTVKLARRNNDGTIRIPLHHLEMLEDLSEELLVRRGGLDIYLQDLNMLSRSAQQHLALLEPHSDIHDHQAIANLQKTVEQMVNVLMLTEQQSHAINQDVCHLRKNLQQVLNHPISSLVKRFPRILRDLSVQYGKQVELVVQGADIEIERLISEAIAEPLELLLRNAFEHGIESPEQRQRAGKTYQGKIEFIATQNVNNTIIKVTDDGCGIDIHKIRNQVEQAAAIAGLSGFSTMDMNDQQLMNLIFEPTLNIAPHDVDSQELSGSPTTLSSVKKKLNKFGGTISVQSQIGKGTEFTLVLPNMLSLIRVLLIDINQMCLAIPSKIVLEVIPRDITNQGDEEPQTLAWRDRLLPIVRLDSLLQLNCRQSLGHLSSPSAMSTNQEASRKPANAAPSFLIVNHENDLFALQTDGCWHDQEATFHQIEGDIALPHIFLGAVILGNNQAIALINSAELINQGMKLNRSLLSSSHTNLDINNLSGLSDFFNMGDDLSALNHHIQTQQSSRQPRALIVESSANVRRYLAMTLTKSGFLTEQVQDGKEAIALLKQVNSQHQNLNNLNIDVVITDLEMPQMDGFKLLASMRDDADLQNLPIVVLTAKNNENDQKLALELGAKAYFSKPYREEELVKTLFRLVA